MLWRCCRPTAEPDSAAAARARARETTPLQTKLEIMAGQIGAFGLAAALFSLIAMAGQFSWAEFAVAGRPWSWDLLPTYLHFVITAITIVVCAPGPGAALRRVTAVSRRERAGKLLRGAACVVKPGRRACQNPTQRIMQSFQSVSKQTL